MLVADFYLPVTTSRGRVSARMAAIVPDPDVNGRVSSVATEETVHTGGPPGPTDDLTQHIGNENACEHVKFDGFIMYTSRFQDGQLHEYGFDSIPGIAHLSCAGFQEDVSCSVILAGNQYWVILPHYSATATDMYGNNYTVHFGYVVTGIRGKSGAVFYYTQPGTPARVDGVFVACWPNGVDDKNRIYTKSTSINPNALSDLECFDPMELPWTGSWYRNSVPRWNLGTNIPPGTSFSDWLVSVMNQVVGDCDAEFYPDHPMIDVWGELANMATSSVKATSSNVLSTANETFHICKGVIDLLQAAAAVKTASPKKFLKAVGNLRLAWKWGIPLTVKDAHAIADGVTDKVIEDKIYTNPNRIHVKHSTMFVGMIPKDANRSEGKSGKRQCWLKILYKDNNTAKKQAGSKLAADLNLVTLENGWDVVPYSFVVDWLTDFGSVLNAADNVMYRTAYWDILGSVRGTKDWWNIDTRAFARYDPCISGHATCIHYVRRVYETIPLPTLGYLNPSIGVTQWLDGATLVSQLCE